MNRLFAVLGVALLAVAVARADVAPPPGKKVIPVTTVVEAAEAFPDYAFFESGSRTYYGSPQPSVPGQPPQEQGWRTDSWATRVDISPGRLVSRTGERRDGATLFAIPKAAADAQPDANELIRAARANTIPGAAFIPFGVTQEVPAADPRTAITVRYRVARTPAGVAFVDAEVPTGDVMKCGNDGPDERGYEVAGVAVPWRWVAAGGASSLALVLAGVWLVWRVRRTT